MFIGSPASGHKYDVETSKASNWDEEQACNAHYSQPESSGVKETLMRTELQILDEGPPPSTLFRSHYPKLSSPQSFQKRIRDNGVQAVNVLAVVEDEEQAKAEHCHDVSRQRQEEEEEVPVVPPTNAVVDPWAVVVEVLHWEGEETVFVQQE